MEECKYKLPCGRCDKFSIIKCDAEESGIECEFANVQTDEDLVAPEKVEKSKAENKQAENKDNGCIHYKIELVETRTIGDAKFDIYVCQKCGETYMYRHIERH